MRTGEEVLPTQMKYEEILPDRQITPSETSSVIAEVSA